MKAVNDARVAARKQIDTVGLRRPPPGATATPEQVAEYRKEVGIPDKPEGYAMPEGLVLGEADKPLATSYTKWAHDNHMTPDQVQQNLKWWHGENQRLMAETVKLDGEAKAATLGKLATDWGADAQKNKLHLDQFLEGIGIKGVLMDARDPSGRPLGANYELIKALSGIAAKINPIISAGFSGNAAGVSAANGELDGLKKMMGDSNSAYWKGAQAATHQARYRELLVATGQAEAA